MRTPKQFDHTFGYIHQNPVKVGLCREAMAFPFNSAKTVRSSVGDGCFERAPIASEIHERAKQDWEALREACRLKSAIHKAVKVERVVIENPAD
jgi:hypothetical protein